MRPRLLSPMLMADFNIMVSLRNNATNDIESRKRRLLKVKKDLFGPVNHEDSRAFVERELKSMSDIDSARWNFDFKNEKPLDVPNPRYIWEKVTPEDSIPEAYALNRLSYLSKNAVLVDNTNCNNNQYHINNNNIVSKEDLVKERQTQITEFMKSSRKRRISATVSKLSTDDMEPQARKRSLSYSITTSQA